MCWPSLYDGDRDPNKSRFNLGWAVAWKRISTGVEINQGTDLNIWVCKYNRSHVPVMLSCPVQDQYGLGKKQENWDET